MYHLLSFFFFDSDSFVLLRAKTMPWECHVWLTTHYSPYSLSRRPYAHDLQHAQSYFLFFGFYLLVLRFSLVTPLLKYEACFEVIYVQYIMNEWIFEHCIWVVYWAAGHL